MTEMPPSRAHKEIPAIKLESFRGEIVRGEIVRGEIVRGEIVRGDAVMRIRLWVLSFFCMRARARLFRCTLGSFTLLF